MVQLRFQFLGTGHISRGTGDAKHGGHGVEWQTLVLVSEEADDEIYVIGRQRYSQGYFVWVDRRRSWCILSKWFC